MKRYNRKLYDNIANRISERLLWLLEWFSNFIINLFRYGVPNLSIKRFKQLKKNDDLVIIANGPSINNSLDDIIKHECSDFACMNYFPIKSNLFDSIRPIFFFAMDRMMFDPFYKDLAKRRDTIALKDKLEKVDWNMTIFTRKDMSFLLSNPFINEIRISTNQIPGPYSRFRKKLFDLDMAVPSTATVAAYAILCGIKMGYKNIYVYGIDCNIHESVYVNDKNETVTKIRHFYEEKNNDVKDNKVEYDISSLFFDSYKNISGYRILRKYAESHNVNIYNCTKDSFVDAFLRFT